MRALILAALVLVSAPSLRAEEEVLPPPPGDVGGAEVPLEPPPIEVAPGEAVVFEDEAEAVATSAPLLPLSLAEAVTLAMEGNLTLQAARFDEPVAFALYEAADASFDSLLTAGLDVARNETPSTFSFTGTSNDEQDVIGLRAGWQRALRRGGSVTVLYEADRLDSNSAVAAVNPAYSNGLSVQVVKPLLRGAGDVALTDLRQRSNDIETARATLETAVETLLAQVVGAYWELAYTDALIEARRKSLEVAEELLDDAESRRDAEVGTPLDVAEARAGLERRRSDLLEAEGIRGTQEDQLLALMMPFGASRSAGRRIVLTDSLEQLETAVPTLADARQYVGLALRGRSELRASRAQIANRSLDVLRAHDAIRPQLDLRGSLGSRGLDSSAGRSLEDVLTGRAVSLGVGVEISMALGRRAARANWRAAAWARRQAQIRLRETENQIVVQVRAALRRLETALAQVRAGEEEVRAAVEGQEGEREKLQEGYSTPFRVLQKEDDMTAARTRVARARANLKIAEAELWRAVGQLAQNLGVEVPRWGACNVCR